MRFCPPLQIKVAFFGSKAADFHGLPCPDKAIVPQGAGDRRMGAVLGKKGTDSTVLT